MLRSAKADFVREHPDYGYGDVEEFEERRRADFPTLLKAPRADAEGLAASEMLYVDFAGAAPLPKRLLEASTAALLQSVPCNPHRYAALSVLLGRFISQRSGHVVRVFNFALAIALDPWRRLRRVRLTR
eukprot:scaffold1954_cov268-Pinguiococcus_pyrenoidosus.AAC.191